MVALGKVRRDKDCGFQVLNYFYEYIGKLRVVFDP